MQKVIVVITGPTGVGKSKLAELLADHGNAEIINADMGQMYTPLSIGTAKPELDKARVPHHLFNTISAPKPFTVVKYRDAVKKLIDEIWERNALPIIVGGSSFYIQSLFFPPVQNESIDMNALPAIPQEGMWDALNKIDSDRAAEIHKHDFYRLERALAIWYATGKKPTELKPVYNPIAPYLFLFVNRDRKELYERINERVKEMIAHGWLKEAERLLNTPWESFLHQKKIIGYPAILTYLRSNEDSQEQLCSAIAQDTRHYAKRQIIFWRRLERMLQNEIEKNGPTCSQVQTCNLTESDLDLYIKQLLKKLALLKESC